MASIQDSIRLMKRAMLTNLFIERGISITPLLNGAHGIGKSYICNSVAKTLGGTAATLEASAEKEGEITGIPYIQNYLTKDINGNEVEKKSLKFAPHYLTDKIQRVEETIYNKATTTGFMNGTIKLDSDGVTHYVLNGNEETIEAKSSLMKIFDGEENKYEFGENLPGEVKLKLLETGEILPIILFIDELNRTDTQTMKELMNIILTKTINGYKLPWWVFVVSAINPCSQDSIYATNEMDAAQLDRFLKINVTAKSEEWVNYAIANNLDPKYIIAATVNDDNFKASGKGYDDTSDDMLPTPRSHEMCCRLYMATEALNNSRFFTREEVANTDEDLRTLFVGKLGKAAGATTYNGIKNSEWYINPAELLSGKEKKIEERFSKKLRAMKPVLQNVLASTMVSWFARDGVKVYFEKDDKTLSAEKQKAAKQKWSNILDQVIEVLTYLQEPIRLKFSKDAYATNINLDDVRYSKYNSETLFSPLVPTFSKAVIEQMRMTNYMVDSGNIDKH